MNAKRLLPFLAAILLMVGTAIFLVHGRVAATYLLDAIVLTIGPNSQVPPPWDYSWGTMTFHQSIAQLGASATGLLIALCGTLWLIPSWAAKGVSFKGWQRVLLGLVGLSLLAAAAGSYLLARDLKLEFASMAHSSVPDPDAFGESLGVPLWNVARLCLCIVAVGFAVLALSAKRCNADEVAKPNRALMMLACAGLGYFFGLMFVLCIGPATRLAQLAQPGADGDPEIYAALISTGVSLMTYSSFGLLLAGVLVMVAAGRKLGTRN